MYIYIYICKNDCQLWVYRSTFSLLVCIFTYLDSLEP